jgi:25S rRNA (adenine2142-N1)-methyltransferase
MTRVNKKKTKKSGSILLSRHRGLNGDGPSVVARQAVSSTSSLSSKAGRTLIRRHHALQKRLSQAVAKRDLDTADSIRAEIEANGGLEKYQQASVRSMLSLLGGIGVCGGDGSEGMTMLVGGG